MFTVRASALGCFHSVISTQTFWRALTASVDSGCPEIKSAPSVAEFGGRCRKAMLGVWATISHSVRTDLPAQRLP